MAAGKLSQRILDHLNEAPGCSDRELTDLLVGRGRPLQPVNSSCRSLSAQGWITRSLRSDGILGNFIPGQIVPVTREPVCFECQTQEETVEDDVKHVMRQWLATQGYVVRGVMARAHGIDIEACDREGERPRWVIEVKGFGSGDTIRGNFFITILGETLQRMSDPNARYSIALPDTRQYRHLWETLPAIAKERTGITCLLVGPDGKVEFAH